MAIRVTVCIQGLLSGFITIGRYRKWLTDINLMFILIRQMAALVRRAVVCTVQVLLVMAALCNRADHYIFALWFLSSIFYLFFPRLSSAAVDWMSTILRHMVRP